MTRGLAPCTPAGRLQLELSESQVYIAPGCLMKGGLPLNSCSLSSGRIMKPHSWRMSIAILAGATSSKGAICGS